MRFYLLAAVLYIACPALAEGDVHTLNVDAQTEYDLGHFRRSLELFERLYRAKPLPAVLFDIAQCHRRLGELKEAADTYRSFLVKADPQSREAQRAHELLLEVEEAIRSEHGARDAAPHGTAPLPPQPTEALVAQPQPLAPPPSTTPTATSAPPPPNPSTPLAFPRKPEPAPASAPPTSVIVVRAAPAPRSHVVSYTAAGVGVAALATGIVFGLKSKSADSSLSGSQHASSDANDLINTYQTSAKIADVLFAGAAILGLAAVLAW